MKSIFMATKGVACAQRSRRLWKVISANRSNKGATGVDWRQSYSGYAKLVCPRIPADSKVSFVSSTLKRTFPKLRPPCTPFRIALSILVTSANDAWEIFACLPKRLCCWFDVTKPQEASAFRGFAANNTHNHSRGTVWACSNVDDDDDDDDVCQEATHIFATTGVARPGGARWLPLGLLLRRCGAHMGTQVTGIVR